MKPNARVPWVRFSDGLEYEVTQLKEESRCINRDFEEEVARVLSLSDGTEKDKLAIELYEKGQKLPYASGENKEPDEIEFIRMQSLKCSKIDSLPDNIVDHVYGGWLGRCAGCLLGKPVEGWKQQMIRKLAAIQQDGKLQAYLTSDVPQSFLERYKSDIQPWQMHGFIDTVDGMPEDDDTNYTIIALKLLESYGRDFDSDDVKSIWLQNLPYYHLCTAERVAYRNMVMNYEPPMSAKYCNGYREWIGAQIRADLFGYINPGDPEKAAEMAYRDARISHVKNGIYGEMWVAGMIAAAFVSKNLPEIIRIGLSVIPKDSRLFKSVSDVLDWHENGCDGENMLVKIRTVWNESNQHHWCHTVSNAQIVAAALLGGNGEYEKTICLAVSAGFDTDCNGATAGSILGTMLGKSNLPDKWISPLHDTLYSGVDGFSKSTIYDLALRTCKMIQK